MYPTEGVCWATEYRERNEEFQADKEQLNQALLLGVEEYTKLCNVLSVKWDVWKNETLQVLGIGEGVELPKAAGTKPTHFVVVVDADFSDEVILAEIKKVKKMVRLCAERKVMLPKLKIDPDTLAEGLRLLDGKKAGASHGELARVVYPGLFLVDEESARAKANKTLILARRLMGGGFRRL